MFDRKILIAVWLLCVAPVAAAQEFECGSAGRGTGDSGNKEWYRDS